MHLHDVMGACVGAAVGSWSPHHADWSPHSCALPPGHAVLFLALGKQNRTGYAGLILSLSSRDKHRVCIQGQELKNTHRLDSFAQKHVLDPIIE